MRCTLSKLFASVGAIVCGGPTSMLKDLDKISAVNFLSSYKCHVRGSYYSLAHLVINKVTPERINVELLGSLDICQQHSQKLTIKHKSVSQRQCCVEECSKAGEADKNKQIRRVSFEVSENAFLSSGLHILVGSTLCCGHRKSINKDTNNTQSTGNSAETLYQPTSTSALSNLATETLSLPPSSSTLSDLAAETLSQPTSSSTLSNQAAETLSQLTSSSTLSNLAAETLSKPTSSSALSSQAAGTLSQPTSSSSLCSQAAGTLSQPTSSSTLSSQAAWTMSLSQPTSFSVSSQAAGTLSHPNSSSSQASPSSTLSQVAVCVSLSEPIRDQHETISKQPSGTNHHGTELQDPTATGKRKSFVAALEKLPKLVRLDSESSSLNSSSQQLMQSQGSTFSSTSEADEETQLKQFNSVISCLTQLDPVLDKPYLAPLDLQVQTRTLQR